MVQGEPDEHEIIHISANRSPKILKLSENITQSNTYILSEISFNLK